MTTKRILRHTLSAIQQSIIMQKHGAKIELFDLAERGQAQYTCDAILWHPDAIYHPASQCQLGDRARGARPVDSRGSRKFDVD
jgi:hypothetical protein